MTVTELIDQLTELQQQGLGETQVVLSVTDHTDWTYNFDFPGFDIEPVYDEDGEFESEDEDGNEIDYCVCSISV
jgi:hypothetical protein